MIVTDLFEAGSPLVPGFINKATGREWSADELRAKKPKKVKKISPTMPDTPPVDYSAIRAQKQKAAAAAAQAQMSANLPPVAEPTPAEIRAAKQKAAIAAFNPTPSMAWADPKSSQYVGRREVARRLAQQPATTPSTTSFARKPAGYSAVKMNAPTTFSLPSVTAMPKPPATPKVQPAPALSKDEYIRRIGAPALPESVVAKVSEMLESVKTKKDINQIRSYIDSALINESYKNFKLALHEHVTAVFAVKRRIAAKNAAI